MAVPLGVAATMTGTRSPAPQDKITAPLAEPDPGTVEAAAGAVRAFTADMYRELALPAGAARGNLVCSPYSAAVALAMARVGARGQTADEMDTVLHAPAPRPEALDAGLGALDRALAALDDPAGTGAQRPRLSMANALWPQYDLPLHPAFVDTLTACYDATAHPVDFRRSTEAARLEINAWVNDRTSGRIPQLLASGVVTTMTCLVLTNAIYLKANWEFPFPDKVTAPAPFTTELGDTIQVPMMTLPACDVGYLAGQGWQAVDLPYVGSELAMAVVVPEPGLLAALEQEMDGPWLQRLLTGFTRRQARIRLPRWTFRLPSDLGEILVRLGMPTAFTPQADLSGMSPTGGLYISRVMHEAFIAVDEYGTEAAAATAAVVSRTSVGADVSADRPFLYVIHDVATATPLFVGRVTDPTTER